MGATLRGIANSGAADLWAVCAALVNGLRRMQKDPAQIGLAGTPRVKPQHDKHYDNSDNKDRVFKWARTFGSLCHTCLMIPQLSQFFFGDFAVAPYFFLAVGAHDVRVGAFAGN